MLMKGPSADVLRASISSAPSTSSHGSVQDECDSLGDVYVWGEVVCDSSARTCSDTVIKSTGKTDILLPKPLESHLVLDVYHVDCGVRHAALVTKSGEVFTWGEDSGGRLGHGTREDSVHPRLVESLTVCNVDFIACGEFHTCAVTTAGELYTWGDGTHNVGLLGHGTDVGHWIPKRISGPLEGFQVAYVSCGTWHTALVTSMGQLFTFGDGSFGVLGHGDLKGVSYPREVGSLSGLKTIAVACGVWHTAAVSPLSRRSSPPRSTTPVPTGHGLSLSKNATDNLVKANELLKQEVERLHAQVDNLRNRCELHEFELQKSAKKVQEAMALVAEESAKSKAAKEVIKSLTAQLKDMAERLPPEHGAYNISETKQVHVTNGIETHVASYSSMNGIHQPRNELLGASVAHSPNSGPSSHSNGIYASENSDCSTHSLRITSPHELELPNRRTCSSTDDMLMAASCRMDDNVSIDARSLQNSEDGCKPRGTVSLSGNQVQAEWIEQYEPGVYITLTTLRDGTRDLKRVRFSRRRFGEHQAENWWNENREKVYERYNVKSSERVSSAASTRSAF